MHFIEKENQALIKYKNQNNFPKDVLIDLANSYYDLIETANIKNREKFILRSEYLYLQALKNFELADDELLGIKQHIQSFKKNRVNPQAFRKVNRLLTKRLSLKENKINKLFIKRFTLQVESGMICFYDPSVLETQSEVASQKILDGIENQNKAFLIYTGGDGNIPVELSILNHTDTFIEDKKEKYIEEEKESFIEIKSGKLKVTDDCSNFEPLNDQLANYFEVQNGIYKIAYFLLYFPWNESTLYNVVLARQKN